MGIIFVRTNSDNIKGAEHLAPSYMLDRLMLPDHVGFMAVDEEKRVSAGLAICQMVGTERLDIVWLFVHENFRNMSVGEQLLMASCDVAMNLGYKTIGFKLEARDITEEDVRNINGYLTGNGFGLGFSIEGSILANASDVVLNMDRLTDIGEVLPVTNADPVELEDLVKRVSILYDDREFNLDDFAADLSFSYKKEGQLQGLLLCKVVGEIIHVFLLEPSNNEDVMGLLLKTLIEMAKHLGVKNFTIVRTHDNDEALNKLFDTVYSLPAYLWLANADMYDNEPEETGDYTDPIYVPVPERVRWLETQFYGDVL